MTADIIGGQGRNRTTDTQIFSLQSPSLSFSIRPVSAGRQLLALSSAEREGDLIHLTLLGRACGASSLSFESSLRLVELMGQLDAARTPPFHMLALIQVLDEMDAVYTPVMKRGQSESVRVSEAAQRFGQQTLQRYCRDQFEFWARCKRAALLHDWMDGAAVDALEKHYSTTPFGGAIGYGNIIGIADATRFHLRSAHQILSSLLPDQPGLLQGLDEILQRLEFGLPTAALPLTKLQVPLTRGQCLALAAVGVRDAVALSALDDDRLRNCVGAAVVAMLRPRKQEFLMSDSKEMTLLMDFFKATRSKSVKARSPDFLDRRRRAHCWRAHFDPRAALRAQIGLLSEW